MTLPPNAAFKSVIGPFCGSTHLSKQLVCLDACKKLHELGALNDQLLPINEQPEKSDSIVKNKASSAGALVDFQFLNNNFENSYRRCFCDS